MFDFSNIFMKKRTAGRKWVNNGILSIKEIPMQKVNNTEFHFITQFEPLSTRINNNVNIRIINEKFLGNKLRYGRYIRIRIQLILNNMDFRYDFMKYFTSFKYIFSAEWELVPITSSQYLRAIEETTSNRNESFCDKSSGF